MSLRPSRCRNRAAAACTCAGQGAASAQPARFELAGQVGIDDAGGCLRRHATVAEPFWQEEHGGREAVAANVGAAPGARADLFAQGREHGHAGQRAALVPFTVRADQKERLLVAMLRALPVNQCGEVKG